VGTLRGPTFLDPDDVSLAALRYYALFHPRPLTRVCRWQGRNQYALLTVADTGFGNKVVTLIAPDAGLARCLLYRCLAPGTRFFFQASPSQACHLTRWLRGCSEETWSTVASVSPQTFTPIPGPQPERYRGTRAGGMVPYVGYRFTAGGESICQAFVLWQSDRYAEVGVFTRDDFRGRGLARRAVSSLTAELLEKGVTPLYVYDPSNQASRRVSEALGYRPAGRQFSCYGRLPALRPGRPAP